MPRALVRALTVRIRLRLGIRLRLRLLVKFRLMMPVRLRLASLQRRADPDRLFVGWMLFGGQNDGSTRMRGLLPHAYLRTRGVHSVVVARRLAGSTLGRKDVARIARAGFDVVVFETVGGRSMQELALALRAEGTRTVYAVGELRRNGMPKAVDRVVLASESLYQLTGGPSAEVSIIESPIESPEGACKDYSGADPSGRIRVVWVGYPANLPQLAPVTEALRRPQLDGFDLITVSRGPLATVQWDRKQVWSQLLWSDIAVLPYDASDWQRSKPNTRLTMLKALGLPIVATPIPSFTATLTHGRGCLYARNVDEWAEALLSLADRDRRREMGLAARDEIVARYGLESIGGAWLKLLEDLHRTTPSRDHRPL